MKRRGLFFGSIAVLLVTAAFGQTQSNSITGIRSTPDQTIIVSWNSDVGGVYEVDSADSLTGVGAQGVQWVIRDVEFPSRGTNTQWMDVGDTRWIPGILHPRLVQQRFYRIGKYGQATLTPPVVTAQLSETNSPLPSGTNQVNGFVNINVSVTAVDTNEQMSSVGVYVDGQPVYTASSSTFTATVNTAEWPNGIHQIYAIATMIDAPETLPSSDSETVSNSANLGIGVSATQFGVFSNYISQFFIAAPYFDPASAQTQQVTAAFGMNSYWQLNILNCQGTSVRQFQGQGSSLFAAWDGNDQSGSPLPYGYYDYYIQARPSQYGSLSAASGAMVALGPTGTIIPPGVSLAAAQFSRSNTCVRENIVISSSDSPDPSAGSADTSAMSLESSAPPCDTPTNSASDAWYPTSAEQAVAAGRSSYFIRLGSDDCGQVLLLEVSIPPSEQQEILEAASNEIDDTTGSDLPTDEASPQSWPDAVYTTDAPTRFAGSSFMGYAGTVGVGYQGDHPSSPSFPLPSGGVISLSHPPYGPLKNASAIANGFSDVMAASAWRTSFLLGDDNFNSTNLFPVLGPASGTSSYATKCDFGLYVGHMTATATTDPDYQCTHSWVPIYESYQPGRYQWIPLPGCDFGNGSSRLKWMALYGCNSLQQADVDNMWTQFILPMPPNLRLLLGAEDGVFIDPSFGYQFAQDMNGVTTPNNQPMTIVNSWLDAASVADTRAAQSWRYKFIMGTRHMTYVYRDDLLGGSWRTSDDSIWNWSNDISTDWNDIYWIAPQVYPP